MEEKEKQRLLERYKVMPEEELNEMLSINENEYEKGVYQLLIDTAKSRGLGVETKEKRRGKMSNGRVTKLSNFWTSNLYLF